jgi:hypothetical protein
MPYLFIKIKLKIELSIMLEDSKDKVSYNDLFNKLTFLGIVAIENPLKKTARSIDLNSL